MQLKYMFETIELGDQIIAVPIGQPLDEYHGVLKLNETAAVIFNLLNKDTSKGKI